jgi:hypothetical protein
MNRTLSLDYLNPFSSQMRPKCHYDDTSPHDTLTAAQLTLSPTISKHPKPLGLLRNLPAALLEPERKYIQNDAWAMRRRKGLEDPADYLYEQTPVTRRLVRLAHRAPRIWASARGE